VINQLLVLFIGANALVLAVAMGRILEKRWPIDAQQDHANIVSDWKVTGANIGMAWLMGPLTGAIAAGIVSGLGGGFIHLRTDGGWYVVSLVGYVIALDLWSYFSHRLEHAVPFLWSMHSLHHSAEAVTFITGGRHYWLERALFGAFLPVLPILFDIPPDVATAGTCIFFLPDTCAHLNVRFPMGRAITWLNSPQWHRIHHSALPEHRDKNFASLLPLWDILFGTAWVPESNEYPCSGIKPHEEVSAIDGIVWPFRRHVRRLRGAQG
jgi:sterol desaturase/sphingolipid hydroxylase (fatty acid hydroxylase superfamily)